jgi:hypothetical protein
VLAAPFRWCSLFSFLPVFSPSFVYVLPPVLNNTFPYRVCKLTTHHPTGRRHRSGPRYIHRSVDGTIHLPQLFALVA